ncbi:MAG: 50S ribosomal protein L1 [Bacilli bacterium]|jgi:large subunit ribosomal protein L1|nr:50S ribosomal protein L1 [Acholeplasmataceae bacterium]HOA78413.1 50S ribosomal protein L1 [Bacilli bacterium]HPZ28039.1 50S ribosomal protein L1 [Bacilli bacterium]HQC89594.1 50S ribosomal protein L1 [Bacilli bacterium]
MAKRSRKYQEAIKLIDRTKRYTVEEAIELAKKTNIANFDATVEVVFRLNLDPRKAEQNLRGAIVLPHGTGKEVRVLVLTKTGKQKEAEAAGADYVGDAEYLEKIKKGWLDFDVIIATPDMMGELGKLGKILGPKGLMPNAKTGTVTMDVERAVQEVKAGKVTFRVDKNGNIPIIVGKVSFDDEKLVENIRTVYQNLVRLRPQTVKGVYVKNISLSTSMSPGIKIAPETLA